MSNLPKKKSAEIRKGIIIIALIMSGICFCLGVWQIKRKIWKEDLIAFYHSQMRLPSVDINGLKDNILYRKVKAKGYFLPQKMAFLGPKVVSGKLGYHVFVPFVVTGQSDYLNSSNTGSEIKSTKSNSFIWVNIGWIDNKIKQSIKLSSHPQKTAQIIIEGFLTDQAKHKSRYTPDNKVQANEWFWLDTDAMNDHFLSDTKLQHLNDNCYLHISSPHNLSFVTVSPVIFKRHFYNNHLSYIITWLSLCVLIIVFAVTNVL